MVEASLHLAFGLGTGWMLTDAMFIEAAHMGQTQPEGLALATYLTGSGMIANVVVVPLFYILQRRLSWQIERWVWVGLLFQISSAVLAALSWRGRLRAPLGCAAARLITCLLGRSLLTLGSSGAGPTLRMITGVPLHHPSGRAYYHRRSTSPPQAGKSVSDQSRLACTLSHSSPQLAATSSSWRSCRGCRRAPRGPHASRGRWQALTWARCARSFNALQP